MVTRRQADGRVPSCRASFTIPDVANGSVGGRDAQANHGSSRPCWRLALLGAAAMPAHGAEDPPIRCGSCCATRVPNIDPYYNNLRTGLVMHAPGLGRAGLSRPGHLRDQAAARDRMEIRRCRRRSTSPCGTASNSMTAARSPPTTSSTRSTWSPSPDEQGLDAVELQLDRQGREDRRSIRCASS